MQETATTLRERPALEAVSSAWSACRRRSSLFLHQYAKPVGASTRYSKVGFLLPGHLVPAAFFNEGSSLPGTDRLQFLEPVLLVRGLGELGDADRRASRQERRFAHLL